MRLMILNLFWMLFTVMGLIVAGFFPATTAMFAIIRKWMIGQSNELPIFKTFFKLYTHYFIQANLLGVIYLAIGALLTVDLHFFRYSNGLFTNVLLLVIYSLIAIYSIMLLYLFPVYVHYEQNILENVKYTFILTIARPLHALLMVITLIATLLMFRYLPGLVPFCFGSVSGFVVMKIASLSFVWPISAPKIRSTVDRH